VALFPSAVEAVAAEAVVQMALLARADLMAAVVVLLAMTHLHGATMALTAQPVLFGPALLVYTHLHAQDRLNFQE
jgi:hypothetical protein